MAYKETALVAQFNGAFRCATTVIIRTSAADTIHHVVPTNVRSKENLESMTRAESGDNNNNNNNNLKNSKNGVLSSSHNVQELEALRHTLWVARSDGEIEVRVSASPDCVINRIPRKSRAIVTALLQIGHNRVVAGLSDGTLRVFDAATLRECHETRAHASAITCMVAVTMPTAPLSPSPTPNNNNNNSSSSNSNNGASVGFPHASVFLTASSDWTIAKWDGVTLECLGRLKGGHRCGVTSLAATRGGTFVFSGGEDGGVRMWSLIENTEVTGGRAAGRRPGTTKRGNKKKEIIATTPVITPPVLLPLNRETQQQQQQHTGQKSTHGMSRIHTPRTVTTATASAATTPRAGRQITKLGTKTTRASSAAVSTRTTARKTETKVVTSSSSTVVVGSGGGGEGRRKVSRARSDSPCHRTARSKKATEGKKRVATTPRLGMSRRGITTEIYNSNSRNEEEKENSNSSNSDNDEDSSDTEYQAVNLQDEISKTRKSGKNFDEEKKLKKSTKTKKSKKTFSQFSNVLLQLLRDTRDIPMSRHLVATHGFLEEETNSGGILLWPLKREHYQTITNLALVCDRLLVTASRDGTAKMFALPSGRLLNIIHRSHVALTSLAVDETRCLLWIGSADGSLHIYNVFHKDIVQVHTWRDLSTPYPILVPLSRKENLNQLYILCKSFEKDKKVNNKLLNNSKSSINKNFTTNEKSRSNIFPHIEIFKKYINSKLTSVLLDNYENDSIVDMRFLYALDKKFISMRKSINKGGKREKVFYKILRRPVSNKGEELPEYIANEKIRIAIALNFFYPRLLLQRVYEGWKLWRLRRIARYRRMRQVCFLANIQQEKILGNYFRSWRQRILNKRKFLFFNDLRILEKRISHISQNWIKESRGLNFAYKIGNILNKGQQSHILQKYYMNWFILTSLKRRKIIQSTCFNRLFLSFCNEKFNDNTFIWKKLSNVSLSTQKNRRALWILEERINLHYLEKLKCYFKKWILFIKIQREIRHSLILVDTLSSMLVNESSLRLRVYYKWYRFALFESKIIRFNEEKITMQREWIVVQNAVDSTTSISELREEGENLEMAIAQLAFERDEIELQNAAICADMENLQLHKSLDCLLAGYRDAPEPLRGNRGTGSIPRNRRSISTSSTNNNNINNISRDRISIILEDENNISSESTMLRQVGAVLRALKATALRFGRHRPLIFAAQEKILQLPIYEWPIDGGDRSSSVSFSSITLCSTGDSLVPRNNQVVSTIEGKIINERRRSITSNSTNSTCLADEFDRTTQRLQVLIKDAAKQTGVDLDEPLSNVLLPSVLENNENKLNNFNNNGNNTHNGVNTTDRSSLRWLNFVPSTTRTEALPLIIDLVTMFDSIKAHSDMEVEGSGKTISTRGAPRTIPLTLRSLCKKETAEWILKHAAVILELMSPGLWERHLRLRVLADGVVDYNSSAPINTNTEEISSFKSITKTNILSETLFTQKNHIESTITPIKQQKQHQQFPKLSMEDINSESKRSRPLSRSAPVSRTQSSQKPRSSFSKPGLINPRRSLHPVTGGVYSTSITPRAPINHDDSREEEYNVPYALAPIPSPALHSTTSTPTKLMYSSANNKRPYLGFRVAVGRDETGRTTLTVHEVPERYISSDGDMEKEGPAFAAGLRAGDQLIRFAGYAVTELAAFNTVVARHVRPSGSIPVVFSRDGTMMSAVIVVGEKSRNEG